MKTKEEPKQFNMHETNSNKELKRGFEAGAEWQSERMYSDMQEYVEFCIECYRKEIPLLLAKDWFEQFKNK